MIESMLRFVALATVLAFASGCGLKGDLYIPEKEPARPAQSEPLSIPEPADADDEQNDDETTGN